MPDSAPRPPLPKQQHEMPGYTAKMQPIPDHGEKLEFTIRATHIRCS